jgi:hypothetical protein
MVKNRSSSAGTRSGSSRCTQCPILQKATIREIVKHFQLDPKVFHNLQFVFPITPPGPITFSNFKKWARKYDMNITSFLPPTPPIFAHNSYHDVYHESTNRRPQLTTGGVYYFGSSSMSRLDTLLKEWKINLTNLTSNFSVRKSGNGAVFYLLYADSPSFIAPHTDQHTGLLLCLGGKRNVYIKRNQEQHDKEAALEDTPYFKVEMNPGDAIIINGGQEHYVLAHKQSLALCITLNVLTEQSA